MKYTAGQAAKAAGVSTATITRALKTGKISGVKNDDGAWVIDPSELHRVYPIILHEKPDETDRNTDPPLANDGYGSDFKALQRELEMLRESLADIRQDRDAWREMAERLSLAPPSPKPSSEPTREATPVKGGFIDRLLRRFKE